MGHSSYCTASDFYSLLSGIQRAPKGTMTKEEVRVAVLEALTEHDLQAEKEEVAESVLSKLFPTPLQKLEQHLNRGTLNKEEIVKLLRFASRVEELTLKQINPGVFKTIVIQDLLTLFQEVK